MSRWVYYLPLGVATAVASGSDRRPISSPACRPTFPRFETVEVPPATSCCSSKPSLVSTRPSYYRENRPHRIRCCKQIFRVRFNMPEGTKDESTEDPPNTDQSQSEESQSEEPSNTITISPGELEERSEERTHTVTVNFSVPNSSIHIQDQRSRDEDDSIRWSGILMIVALASSLILGLLLLLRTSSIVNISQDFYTYSTTIILIIVLIITLYNDILRKKHSNKHD